MSYIRVISVNQRKTGIQITVTVVVNYFILPDCSVFIFVVVVVVLVIIPGH